MQARVLEAALAVQLAQNAQHLAARRATQIADPVKTREGDYVLLAYPDLDLGALVPKIRTPDTRDLILVLLAYPYFFTPTRRPKNLVFSFACFFPRTIGSTQLVGSFFLVHFIILGLSSDACILGKRGVLWRTPS
jgi:hypothetical protein